MTDELELVHKYRPRLFKDVVGQEVACGVLQKMLKEGKLPHALLFVGPSGCGKTTLARVVKDKLGCTDYDFSEINAAEARGIDTVRELKDIIRRKSLSGGKRVFIVDEAHKLTNDAQNAFLKPLEEPPRDVYFFLATTDPAKLIPTLRGRCTEIKVGLVPNAKLEELCRTIAKKEGKELTDECAERIADVADGCARKVVTILHTVLGIKDEGARLEAVQKSEMRQAGIDLARALMPFKGKANWIDVAAILKTLDEDAEGIRRLVMGYYASVMLKTPTMASRCAAVMNFFRDPFYDHASKSVLVLACYEAVQALNG